MPPPRSSGPARVSGAFTLIELLVSMTVLVLVIAMINQLVSGAAVVSTGSSKHLDADGQARQVFERMTLDLAKMIKRADTDSLFVKIAGQGGGTPGDDKFFFYSQVPAFLDGSPTPAPAATSPVALLGYRINTAFQLERLGKVLTWDGLPVTGQAPGGLMFLSARPTPTTALDPDPNSTLAGNWADTIGKISDTPPYSDATRDDADYNVFGEQVFRMEICYFLRPVNHTDPLSGNMMNIARYSAFPVAAPEGVTNNLTAGQPPTVTSDFNAGYQIGSRWYDSKNYRAYICTANTPGAAVWKNLGMQDVSGLVVALAILDGTTGKILPTTAVTWNSKQTQPVQVPNVAGINAKLADVVNDQAAADPTMPDLSITPPRLMAEAWRNTLNASSPTFAQGVGIPAQVASQIRVYQRYIPLNPSP